MISNKYKYAFCDMSYLLVRSAYVVSKGKGVGEYTSGEIVKLVLWTLNKIPRDYGITADRIVFLADKWSPEFGGYYRNYMLKDKVEYKGTRKYITKWDLEKMRLDPEITPEELKKAEGEVFFNEMKQEAKKKIMTLLPNLGITSIAVEGMEADDLAWMSACLLYEGSDKPSVIITKDSDQQYCLTPKFDYFKLPVGGSEPKVITYNEMYETIPEALRNRGVSLYDYHSFLDSLGKGHNDLGSTSKSGIDTTEAILHILNGNYEDVEDVELFKLQMDTFNLNKFPAAMIEEAKNAIMNIENTGKIGTADDFRLFCEASGIPHNTRDGMSDRWFSEFRERFDSKLFSNTN